MTSLMKLAAVSHTISLPIAFRLLGSKHRRPCFTGFAPFLTLSECSASSLGTPGMSDGDHAKMSRCSRRNSTSSPSYFRDSAGVVFREPRLFGVFIGLEALVLRG